MTYLATLRYRVLHRPTGSVLLQTNDLATAIARRAGNLNISIIDTKTADEAMSPDAESTQRQDAAVSGVRSEESVDLESAGSSRPLTTSEAGGED